jgi:hypothetical protein
MWPTSQKKVTDVIVFRALPANNVRAPNQDASAQGVFEFEGAERRQGNDLFESCRRRPETGEEA